MGGAPYACNVTSFIPGAARKRAGCFAGFSDPSDADGKTAYVPLYGNSGVGRPGTGGRTISVIDITSGRVAYVSRDRGWQVAAIDLSTWKVNKLIDTGPATDGLAWATER